MNVDEILRRIGQFGVYQKVIYIILNLIGVIHGIRMLMAVFILYTPKHRCAIPDYPNDTYQIQSAQHERLITRFIPNNTKDVEEHGPYEWCHMYANNETHNDSVSCHRWVYDTSMFENTIVMEFDAVCEDSLLGSHSQTSQMAGFLFGVLFFGAVGDKFGRKVAICVAMMIYVCGGLALSWSPLAGYALFVFLRFVNGTTSAGAYTAVCVLSVEMVGPNKRLWVGVLIHLTFGVGGLVLDVIGYLERDWFFINIIGTIPAVLTLTFWWIIPESPRWLAKQGRMKEAEAVLRKIAKYNGKLFPDSLLTDIHQPASDSKNTEGEAKPANEKDPNSDGIGGGVKNVGVTNGQVNKHVNHSDGQQSTVRDFFRMFTYRVLLVRNLVIFLNWFAVSMAYYGLSLTADQLAAGDLYVNFLLSMCMDLVGNALLLLLLDRLGRRSFHTANMVVGGLSCLIGVVTTMLLPSGLQWITVVVAMIGKLGSSAGFSLIYVYSSELYPTAVRSISMGMASAWARIGSILASYVQQWSLEMGGDFGHALPLLVFGAFSLVAGLLTLILPETLHKDLPDSIEDGLVFGKDPKTDEHVDPKKTVEVFTVGDVLVEMETFHSPDGHQHNRPVHTHQDKGHQNSSSVHRRAEGTPAL